jgi:transposase
MFSTNQLFETALGIKTPWFINEVKFNEDEKRLDIYIDFKKGSEFYYEDEQTSVKGSFKAYDTTNKSWRHLNFFEHEAYLHARVPRIKTDDNKVRIIKTPWEGVNSGFTLLFEAFILQLTKHMPVNVVSKLTGVSNNKLWRIL